MFVVGLLHTVILRLVLETSFLGSFCLVLETSLVVIPVLHKLLSVEGLKKTGIKVESWLVFFLRIRGLSSVYYMTEIN